MKMLTSNTKTYLTVLVIFAAISSFLFQKLLLGDNTFVGPDSMSPTAIKTGIELAIEKNGEYPLWLPWVFSGLPSVHSFQNISHFYIPNSAINFFRMLGMPAFWNYIFHFVFAGMGCFLLLRRLKTDIFSATLGGVAFMLTPYLTTMVVHGHGSQMMTSAYIPWVIWAVWRINEEQNFRNIGLLALFSGLQLQRAHVQIAYYTWLMVGLYLLIEIIQWIRTKEVKKIKSIGYILVGLVIGIGIALSIYLPAISYTPYSIRGAISSGGGTGLEYATQWSFSFGEMMTFIIPSFYGFGGATYWGNMPFTDYPNYMGILILILAIIGAVKCKGTVRILLIFTAILSLLLSFGKHFFLYSLLYEYLPFFKKFRVPAMLLILVQFSVAILAGLGLNYLRENIDKFKKLTFYIFGGLGGLSIVLLLFGSKLIKLIDIPGSQSKVISNLRTELISQDTFTIIILLLVGFLLLWIAGKNWISKNVVFGGIIILSIIDLGIVDSKIIQPSKDSYRSITLNKSSQIKKYLREDEIIKFLKKDTSDYRIFPIGELANENRWSAFNIESIMGYHPAKLNNYNQLMSEVGFNSIGILQMLNVKYLVSVVPINHPAFTKVFEGKLYHNAKYRNAMVYQMNIASRRVFFAENIRSIPNSTEQFELLKHPEFNPIQHSFVSDETDEISFMMNNSTLEIVSKTPDHIVVNTHSEKEQFLIFSEIFYPEGWEVKVNGESAKIYEVNSVLRGVFIAPGNNEIKMDFVPTDILIGKLISYISFLLTLGLIFLPNIRSLKNDRK